MTIRNPEHYLEGVWDWAILRGCFGDTKIEPTDIDGFVERNGRFLVLETKRPGVVIPRGQHLTFEALRRTGVFTILIVWGKQNCPEQMQVYSSGGVTTIFPCTSDQLRLAVALWFRQANR